MCGIAGQIDLEQTHNLASHREVYERMQRALVRRGPDQNGLWLTEDAALVHTRLSVVDLKGGRQPMTLQQGEREYALVYNGELYNTPELRAELEGLGHTFSGHSDTEVLLHAYLQWGDGCVERFNGIFAFAVWERHRRQLFLARDRIGVKPLFYALPSAGGLLFASEIKALLAHPLVEPEVDADGVAELIFIGPGRTPGYTPFRQIQEIPPATCGYYGAGGLRLRRYWRLNDREHTENFEQTAEHVRFLVTDAIKRQLVSDVPVGTFLSGGLDSSLISAVADRCLTEQGEQLQTFSVDYRENDRYFRASKFQPNSDAAFIKQMNAFLQAENHRVVLDSIDVAQALGEAVVARDLPGMADVDSSLLLFCRAIKPHVTVALSGECADEIFGGYPWYRDPEIRAHEGFPWAQSTAWRASFLAGDWRNIDGFSYVDARYRATVSAADVLPGSPPAERRMREMTLLNFAWFMQTLLERKDRMSMYSGLEVRVPFCDWRIAEYLYAVPWSFKDYRGHEKGLLRHAMRGLLPEEVLWRKKSPYPKTHHPDYLSAVSSMLQKILSQPDAPVFQIVERSALAALPENSAGSPWYGQLMAIPQTIAYFLQINNWLERYQVRLV